MWVGVGANIFSMYPPTSQQRVVGVHARTVRHLLNCASIFYSEIVFQIRNKEISFKVKNQNILISNNHKMNGYPMKRKDK